MTDIEYRALDSLCYSDLSNLARSYNYYEYQRSVPPNAETTPALRFGNAYDTYILQPEVFKREYGVLNEYNRPELDKTMASKLNQAWKQDFFKKHGNLYVTLDEMGQLNEMGNALHNNPFAHQLLTTDGGVAQDIATYELFGLPFKSKFDLAFPEKRLILDLKTTQSIADRDLSNSIVKYRYYIQSLLYRWAFEKKYNSQPNFFFIFQEKNPPYEVVVLTLADEWDDFARKEIERLVSYYLDCKGGKGCKTRYSDVLTLEKPHYLNNEQPEEEF